MENQTEQNMENEMEAEVLWSPCLCCYSILLLLLRNFSYHFGETTLFTISPYYGSLDEVP